MGSMSRKKESKAQREARRRLAHEARRGPGVLPGPSAAASTAGAPTSASGEAAAGTPEEPARVTFSRDTMLRYKAGAQKRKGADSTAMLEAYRSVRSVGEFFDPHPGPPGAASRDLGWNLGRRLCSTPGFAPPRRLKSPAWIGPESRTWS